MLKHVLLKEVKEGTLKQPESITQIMTTIIGPHLYDLVPPEGYKCLGSIAVKKDEQPDLSRYCCVKTEYLVEAESFAMFKKKTFVIYGMRRSEPGAVIASTFKASSGLTPYQKTYQLDASGDNIRMTYDTTTAGTPSLIDIFETQDLTIIYKGQGYSIWRPIDKKGFQTITHHVTQGHSKPGLGFLMKSMDSDLIAMPESYTLIKKTEKGKDKENAEVHAYIYSVNCPSNFVALGAAVTTGQVPAPGSFYCILQDYAMPIMFANVKKSHSPDLAFIDPLRRNSEHCSNCPLQQGVNGILPASDWETAHKYTISLPYIIEVDKINYISEKPLERVVVTDIRYEMNKAEYERQPPQNLNALTVINRSHIPQNVAKTLEYTTTSSKAWQFNVGIGLGTTMEIVDEKFEVGPAKLTVKAELSVQVTTTIGYGEEDTTETTDSIEIAMEVEWTSRMNVTVVTEKFTSNIPFVATLKKYYFDGTTDTGESEGVFKGVHVNDVHVQYGEITSLVDGPSEGKAQDIIDEIDDNEDRVICHDPKFLKTKKVFSYPSDARGSPLVFYLDDQSVIPRESLLKMFDGDVYTKFEGPIVDDSMNTGGGVVFDFVHSIVFKRLTIKFERDTNASELGEICLLLDGESPSATASGCDPSFDPHSGEMSWEDFHMQIVKDLNF